MDCTGGKLTRIIASLAVCGTNHSKNIAAKIFIFIYQFVFQVDIFCLILEIAPSGSKQV